MKNLMWNGMVRFLQCLKSMSLKFAFPNCLKLQFCQVAGRYLLPNCKKFTNFNFEQSTDCLKRGHFTAVKYIQVTNISCYSKCFAYMVYIYKHHPIYLFKKFSAYRSIIRLRCYIFYCLYTAISHMMYKSITPATCKSDNINYIKNYLAALLTNLQETLY